MAIHPAGHFFVVGHADGTLAFWAIEEEDRPLSVRTMDDPEEVNIVDGDKIEQYLPSGNVSQKEHAPFTDREPIFKLAWSGFPNSSDPRGGETTLTILGGMRAGGEAAGVTVMWLPPFNPPEPPALTSVGIQKRIHPILLKAMRESTMPIKSYFYNTVGPTQDFVLLPRDSPHFSAAFDPISIIFLSDAIGGTRAVESFQFPPPEFVSSLSTASGDVSDTPEELNASDALSEDLASTLRAMSMTDDPKQLKLMPPLWNGNGGVIRGEIVKLERNAYETFTTESDADDDALPLRGGIARMNDTKSMEAKLSKVGYH
jgi:syntaxin-binding protein 5